MNNENPPKFVVIYRWILKAGMEDQFVESWSQITVLFRDRGSLGSRLHRASDDLWYGYAQWPTAADRQRAFAMPLESPWIARMHAAISETLPEIILEPVSDYLVLPKLRDERK